MALKENYSTDKQKAKDGIWVVADIDENGVEMRFKVAPMSNQNKKLTKLNAELTKPFRRQIANNSLPDAISEKISRTLFIKTVLLDWENVVVNPGDAPLPFTEENAEFLLKELPNLHELLVLQAMDFGNFRSDGNNEAAKN